MKLFIRIFFFYSKGSGILQIIVMLFKDTIRINFINMIIPVTAG